MKKQLAVLVVVLLIAVSQATSQPLFGDPTFYGVGDHPRAVFSVDLDGDSDKDLAVANLGSKSVSILLNNGNGAFVASGEYDAGGEPVSVFSVDFDGDFDNDLAVANAEPDSVSILLNNGDGTFAPSVEYYAGSHPTSIFSTDLDGDLDNDLAVTNYESDSVSILLNNGDGTFAHPVMYGAGDGPHSVFSVDFDGINGNDLALANRISSDVSILLNYGDGTFAPSAVYGVAGHTTTVFSVDLDGNKYNDLAVTTDGDEVSILLNNGDGTFAPSKEYGVGDHPNSVISVDLDGDLDNDLAVSNYQSDDVSILLNNGDGTFASSEEYSVDVYPHWVFSADFDGDGDQDLVTANNNTDNVSILFNLHSSPTSRITGLVSSSGNGLFAVPVYLIDSNNDLLSSTETDETGFYFFENTPNGNYVVEIQVPLGYTPTSDDVVPITVERNDLEVNFTLEENPNTGCVRQAFFWRWQVKAAIREWTWTQYGKSELLDFLYQIHTHYDGYFDVFSGVENLDDMYDILSASFFASSSDRSKKHFFATLLNTVSGRLHTSDTVSIDGGTASQAITYMANVLTDINTENDASVISIAVNINCAFFDLPTGIIPLDIPQITYRQSTDDLLPNTFSTAIYPNPFNPITKIEFNLPNASDVELIVYNVVGQRVKGLANEFYDAGTHVVEWDASNVASGIYFYQIKAGEFVESKKMMLLK